MNVAVIGSGPAGLMAATQLVEKGHTVNVFEKRPAPARKLYIAGGSGLNITNSLPPTEFYKYYTGDAQFWKDLLIRFSPEDWLGFIHKMGLETFEGTSRRYFVSTMNAALLVRTWRRDLSAAGVHWQMNKECTSFKAAGKAIELTFQDGDSQSFDSVCFALGGGSWEPDEKPLRWPSLFKAHDITCQDFQPSNVGLQVVWPEKLLLEAEGLPLKNILLKTPKGEKKGDLVITAYGLEGTPIYTVGQVGELIVDLKPDLTLEKLVTLMEKTKENLSPMRRAQKLLNLNKAAQALLYHLAPQDMTRDLLSMAHGIKNFSLRAEGKQPLDESISSTGGIAMDEVTRSLMLKKIPGVFLAGEMLDWDAPTGGYLLQACVSMGYLAALAMHAHLANRY